MTPQDFDHLSAYIDHQLSPAEKTKLESRLGHEAELQQALADLRLTRRMLQSLPTVKPPRNFTLTRAQAQATARPRFQLFPALRLATALAGFAFVFLLAVDLFALQTGVGGTAAPAMEQALKSTEPTDMVETGAAGGAEVQTEAPPAANPLSAETPTPAPEMSIAAADMSATPTPNPDVSRSAVTVAPTETPLVTAYNFGVTIESDGTTPPTDDGYYAPPEPSVITNLPAVRYLEISLGLLTLLLALAAWRWRNH